MALISQSELEARLQRSLTPEEISAFSGINSALQAYVERLLGTGVESVSASTRYYDGGVQHLKIDPCTSITALDMVDDDQVSSYTYDTSDYTKEPINKTLKTMIRYRSGCFARGINNVRVTAKFSIYEDSDTLAIVKSAMLDALLDLVEDTSNLKRESIEGYTQEFFEKQTRDSFAPLRFLFPEV